MNQKGSRVEALRDFIRKDKLEDAWALFETVSRTPESLYLGSLIARKRFRKEPGNALRWLHTSHNLAEIACAGLPKGLRLLHAEVWYHRARVEIEIGDTAHAYDSLQWLLQYGELAGGPYWPLMQAPVHAWLGLVYRMRREHVLALSHYEQAIAFAERESQIEVLVDALHNAAWLCLLDRNADRAEAYLQIAEPQLCRQEDRWYQRLYTAFLRAERGERIEALDELRALYTDLIPAGDESRPAASVCAWSCYLMARIAMGIGAHDHARACITDGQAWSARGEDIRPMTALSELLRELESQVAD
jgi:tetratricopeptide (TPR) repeat protein